MCDKNIMIGKTKRTDTQRERERVLLTKSVFTISASSGLRMNIRASPDTYMRLLGSSGDKASFKVHFFSSVPVSTYLQMTYSACMHGWMNGEVIIGF